MFIRSSTAINDCLIALDKICYVRKGQFPSINFYKGVEEERFEIELKIYTSQSVEDSYVSYSYTSQEIRDKAFDELCEFLNKNYKLRDFV